MGLAVVVDILVVVPEVIAIVYTMMGLKDDVF
jgi:hypothetical protein